MAADIGAYRVVALDDGLYGGRDRPCNSAFTLKKASDFSPRWMHPVGWKPEVQTPVSEPAKPAKTK